MHAVAQKRFRYLAPDQSYVDALAGDVVAGFDLWPEGNRVAMLESQHVVLVDTAANAVAEPIENQSAVYAASLAGTAAWACDDCDKTFKGASGLSIHRARAHKA